jgi:hypothetical protein
VPEPRNWRDMWNKYADRLLEQTGDDLQTWNDRIIAQNLETEDQLRAWLNERSIHGYTRHLLIHERFGYPDYLQTDDDELFENQYADREHLKPIRDELLAMVQMSHPGVEVVGRKTYIPLYTPRRQFAVIKPTTKKRVDLGLRLDGVSPEGRLIQAKNLGNETINLRIPLESVKEIDDEVAAAIERAWDANV